MLSKSLIFSKRNYRAYLFFISVPVYFYHSLTAKDYWMMLFLACTALFAPMIWTAMGVFVFFKTVSSIYDSSFNQYQIAQEVVIKSVFKNDLEELALVIEANPEILYCEFHRKSLENWCRHYKNTKAQELISELKKKYPKNTLHKSLAA